MAETTAMQNWNPTLWFPADCNHQQEMSAAAYAEHAPHAAYAASAYLYPEHVLTWHKWTHHLCAWNKLLKRPLSWVTAVMMERLWLRELLCEEFQPWNLTGATASILTGLVSLRSVNAPPPPSSPLPVLKYNMNYIYGDTPHGLW